MQILTINAFKHNIKILVNYWNYFKSNLSLKFWLNNILSIWLWGQIEIFLLSVFVVVGVVVVNFSHINLLLQNHWANFNHTSTTLAIKHSWMKRIQVWSNEGQCTFPRRDNNEIAKIYWRNLKFSSPEPLDQFQTDTLLKGIQVCSNEGPCPFLRRDNNEISKIHWFV